MQYKNARYVYFITTLKHMLHICFTYIIYLCALHNIPLNPTTGYKYGIQLSVLSIAIIEEVLFFIFVHTYKEYA